jgi:NADH dehydrogenase/NADH:ubiquinone oxidoreductase subunit G
VREAGGFNIRRNRNNPSALSDHSFGWAVDLDAAENPNLYERFPGRALMAVTGTGAVTGAMDTVAAGGTTQELLAPVEEIRAASQAFEDAFADETSLEQAMRDYLVKRLKYDVPADLPVLELVKAAAGRGKAGTKARADLAGRLRDRWTSIPDAEAFQDAEDREQIVANQGWKAWKAEKARRDAARAKGEQRARDERGAAAKKADQLRKAGKSDEEIRKLVDEPLVASQVKQFQAEMLAMADKAAGTLIELWRIYVSSFERGRTTGGTRVGASSVGTPGSVAAHGFMSMPSRVVAALCGSDGGALDWLGAGLARDFMHFQLTPSQRPPLR